jgi:hypothetical protein
LATRGATTHDEASRIRRQPPAGDRLRGLAAKLDADAWPSLEASAMEIAC